MSMQLYVLLALSSEPTGEAWQGALTERNVPVQFAGVPQPARDTGFVPLTVRGRKTGFYFGREPYTELAELYPPVAGVKLQQPVVWSLGYGGHLLECAAVFYAASVLVARFGGIAFEPQGLNFLTEQQLLDGARLCEELGQTQP